jgi:hypothetical protein
MLDLLETIRTIFSPVLGGHLAARMGESASGMKRALQGAVPLMLSGIAAPAALTMTQPALRQPSQQPGRNVQPMGVTGILVMLGSKDAPNSAMTQGRHLLATFGNSKQAIVNALSQYARIRPAAVEKLLELVGAVLLETINRYGTHQQLDTEGMVALLTSLRGRAKAMLPRELAGMLELPALHAQPRWKPSPYSTYYSVVQRTLGQYVWAQWYIVASVVLLMAGVGAVALEALQVPSATQMPAPNEASQAGETVSAVAEKDSGPLRTIY